MLTQRHVLLVLACMSANVLAANHGHHTHNPTAHTHGEANMTLVFEAGQLLIEFETPAGNLLGVEHRPQTPAQQQRLALLSQQLDVPAYLFGLSRAPTGTRHSAA